MPLASATTASRPGFGYRRGLTPPTLPSLRRLLEQQRQRRIDRMVAETVQLLDHPGIAEDYRAASRRWGA